MTIDKKAILLYISQKSFFSRRLHFYLENSWKGYTVLVSLKNLLIAEILKNSTIYLVYQTLKSKPENFTCFNFFYV